MSSNQKIIVAGVLYAAWGALVLVQKADAVIFQQFTRDCLLGLGLFHAAMSDPKA